MSILVKFGSTLELVGLDVLVEHVSEFTFISRYHSVDYLASLKPLLVRQSVQRLSHLSLLP